MVVMAIGPHPDDIEFGCYATVVKLAQPTMFVIMSAGELCGNAEARIAEATLSAHKINAELDVWRYPDSAIPINRSIIDRLRNCIHEFRPDIIFAPSGLDTHQDHRSVAEIVLAACNGVKKVLFYEMPSTKLEFIPNTFYNVTETFELKLEALKCHQSQLIKPYFHTGYITGVAQYRAGQCKKYGQLFEAFDCYRQIE